MLMKQDLELTVRIVGYGFLPPHWLLIIELLQLVVIQCLKKLWKDLTVFWAEMHGSHTIK